jgi:hypothetical protein
MNTTNPPLPSDFKDLGATWWKGIGPYTLTADETKQFPTDGSFDSPPVHGRGIIRNQLTFSFDLLAGTVSAGVGVSNPSEVDVPMRPYVGVNYPTMTAQLTPVQRVMLIRIDIIDVSHPPANISSWTMNPGSATGSGRAAYPSLRPMVTAGKNGATIGNVQIESFATTI